MRRVLAAIALVLIGLIPQARGAADEPVRVAEWKASHAFRPGDRLEVTIRSGIVRIWGDPGTAKLEIQAHKIVQGAVRKKAEQIAEGLGVTATTAGPGVVSIVVHDDEAMRRSRRSLFQRLFHIGRDASSWVELEVAVPPNCDVLIRSDGVVDAKVHRIDGAVEVEARAGEMRLEEIAGFLVVAASVADVSIADVDGDIDVRSAGGEIEIRRVDGSVQAHATAGQIYCYDVTGDATIQGASGDILVEECGGSLQVESLAGAVTVIRCGSDVRISTRRGSVEVHREGPLPGTLYELESEAGDLDLIVTGPLSARFEAESETGAVQCFLPIEIQSITRHKLTGFAGAGVAPIRLRSGQGDIRIARTD